MRFQPIFATVLGLLSIAAALPAGTKPALKGKPVLKGKACKRSESFNGLAPRTAKPTIEQLEAGAAKIAWALGELGVKKYGLIGGGATALWAHQAGIAPRLTDDFDLIVDVTTTPKLDADIVSRGLTTNAKTKEFFVAKCEDYVEKPFVKVGKVEIAVEIFDWEVWPTRKAYYNLNLPANALSTVKAGSHSVSTLNLGWILRQKMLAYFEREAKRISDMADIVTIHTLMVQKKLTVTVTDPDEIKALKLITSVKGAPHLKGTVICKSIPALA